jgi:hypothetical protein
MRPGKDEEGQYQLGGVAEADVEQSSDRAAGPLRKLIGAAAKPIGEHSDGGSTGEEDPGGRRVEEVAQRQGRRNKQQQGVGRNRNQALMTDNARQ